MGGLWLGIVLAIITVGGVGYWLYGQLFPAPGETTGNAPAAPVSQGADNRASQSAATAAAGRTGDEAPVAQQAVPDPNRSDTILTCTASDGQVFYTNATRCTEADLDNRLNVVPRTADAPALPASRRECLGAQPGGPRVQAFLAVCMEPFNEALKLEPFLLEAEDPATSRAGRRYCDFITQGVQAGCMATSAQFCFLDICQTMRETSDP
jgi:hypothetical protein